MSETTPPSGSTLSEALCRLGEQALKDTETLRQMALSLKKSSVTLPVPRGLLADIPGAGPLAPDEISELADETERWVAEHAAKMDAGRRALAAITDPLARRILDLHAEDERGECQGDDFTGHDAEPPDWPCETVRAIAEHYEIDLP